MKIRLLSPDYSGPTREMLQEAQNVITTAKVAREQVLINSAIECLPCGVIERVGKWTAVRTYERLTNPADDDHDEQEVACALECPACHARFSLPYSDTVFSQRMLYMKQAKETI